MEPETIHPILLLSKSRILTIGSEEGGILRALKGDLMVHARTHARHMHLLTALVTAGVGNETSVSRDPVKGCSRRDMGHSCSHHKKHTHTQALTRTHTLVPNSVKTEMQSVLPSSAPPTPGSTACSASLTRHLRFGDAPDSKNSNSDEQNATTNHISWLSWGGSIN